MENSNNASLFHLPLEKSVNLNWNSRRPYAIGNETRKTVFKNKNIELPRKELKLQRSVEFETFVYRDGGARGAGGGGLYPHF